MSLAVLWLIVALAAGESCPAGQLNLTRWPGSFGAAVHTPIHQILPADCLHQQLRQAFAEHRLLAWAGQQLSPDQEVALMRLLPHDAAAPPEKAYGPLGVPGVDAEKYLRWRIPDRKEILLQGEGAVPAGHHGVRPGRLSSGKPVREWHTDGLYEQDTPSIATSMYCISVKPAGGDTLFMDARVAYAGLDPAARRFWDCARVSYSRTPLSMHASGYRGLLTAERANASANTGGLYAGAGSREGPPSTVHPAVWQLPDGDKAKALVLAPMWIQGVEAEGARPDHDQLHRRLELALALGKRSELSYRWKVGDFVVWDNRALLHSATPNNGFSQEGLRLLHRIRLCGDQVPTGPDGCPAPQQPKEL